MSQTQTQVLAERAVQLGFTHPPAHIVPVPGLGGHQDLFIRRVPTRGIGPLRLTLIPNVRHLGAFADVAIPNDGDWHLLDGFGDCWLRVGDGCKHSPERCVQAMVLNITITHADSGFALTAEHPYKGKAHIGIYAAASPEGLAISQRVLDKLLASDIDWGVDQDMLDARAKPCAMAAWEPEVAALLKDERKRCRAWEKQLKTLDWPATSSTHKDKLIHDATTSRFFWRETRR